MTQPFRGIPIQTAERAQSIGELASDRFKIIARKKPVTLLGEIWEYFIPDGEVGAMHKARDAGRIVTVQGKPEGQTTLYAKLVA